MGKFQGAISNFMNSQAGQGFQGFQKPAAFNNPQPRPMQPQQPQPQQQPQPPQQQWQPQQNYQQPQMQYQQPQQGYQNPQASGALQMIANLLGQLVQPQSGMMRR